MSMSESDSDADYFSNLIEDSDDQDNSISMDESLDVEIEGDEDDEAGPAQGEPRGPAMQIGYHPGTRQVIMIDEQGRGVILTAAHLRGTAQTLASIRRMIGAPPLDGSDEEEEEEDDEEDVDYRYGYARSRKPRKKYHADVLTPIENGVRLERSGEFGRPPPKLSIAPRKMINYTSNLAASLRDRQKTFRRAFKSDLSQDTFPNSSGVVVAEFQSPTYVGNYSEDGSFFYVATKDYKVYIYDTRRAPGVGAKSITDPVPLSTTARRDTYRNSWSHRSSLKLSKTLTGNAAIMQWTITDVNLSPDNTWMAYSSINPRVHLVKTTGVNGWSGDDQEQEVLDFSAGRSGARNFNIWSLRFSKDAREIVAGGTNGQIAVYDIESRQTTLRIHAHNDDVNAVSFADQASSNLLLSGSDDAFIKVWDRRSLSSERASGTLVGHTEGVTFLAPKGDGRYVVSNGKDQTMRLWDLRKMVSDESFHSLRLDRKNFGIPHFDYRQDFYTKPTYPEHPHDVSVMRYRGHSVLQTLIRCNFSPAATTGQRYVYTGSTDGKIHIYHLDGRIAAVLDRSKTHPLINAQGEYNDPSDIALRSTDTPTAHRSTSTVRDVSWSPTTNSMMSTAWEGARGVLGSVALHQWRGGAVGETIEDTAERAMLESDE